MASNLTRKSQQLAEHQQLSQSIENAAHQRLQVDVDDLFHLALPDGLTVIRHPTNDRRFCLHIVPHTGHYRGLRLHFSMEVPEQWPFQSPSISAAVQGWIPLLARSSPWTTDASSSITTFHYSRYNPKVTLQGLLERFTSALNQPIPHTESGTSCRYVQESELLAILDLVQRSRARDIPISDILDYQFYGQSETRKGLHQKQRQRDWESNCSPTIWSSHENFAVASKASQSRSLRISKVVFLHPARVFLVRNMCSSCCRFCYYGLTTKNSGLHLDFHFLTKAPALLPPPYLTPPSQCVISTLNADILATMTVYLDFQSMTSLMVAWPPYYHLLQELHIAPRLSLRCRLFRLPLTKVILGYEVNVHQPTGSFLQIQGPMSYEAYLRTLEGRIIPHGDIPFFVPFPFTEEHFGRAEDRTMSVLAVMGRMLRGGHHSPPSQCHGEHGVGESRGEEAMADTIYAITCMMKDAITTAIAHPLGAKSLLRPVAVRDTRQTEAIKRYLRLYKLLWLISKGKSSRAFWKYAEERLGGQHIAHPDSPEVLILSTLLLDLAPCTREEFDNKGSSVAIQVVEALIRNTNTTSHESPATHVAKFGCLEFQVRFLHMVRPLTCDGSSQNSVFRDCYDLPRITIRNTLLHDLNTIIASNLSLSFWMKTLVLPYKRAMGMVAERLQVKLGGDGLHGQV